MNKFSNTISTLRLSRELSQEQLAKDLGLSKSSIGMWETGKRLPSPELYERIADYFNVDMDYLYGRTDTPRKIIFDEFGNEYINNTISCGANNDIINQLLDYFYNLNETGKSEAIKRVSELTLIETYQSEEYKERQKKRLMSYYNALKSVQSDGGDKV